MRQGESMTADAGFGMRRYPLLAQYPALLGVLPRPLGMVREVPVAPMAGLDGVWIQRDDGCADHYGGNKARKLDFLLAQAAGQRRDAVLTFGYAGSNFVTATAVHARAWGMRTLAVLLPQAPAPYVAGNIAMALAQGAKLAVARGTASAVASATLLSARSVLRGHGWPMWIPPGGSTPVGVAGFVNAALQLAARTAARELPVPRRIYLPLSSMGTVAGLAIGCALAGLNSQIHAVRVVGTEHASRQRLARLVDESVALYARAVPTMAGLAERAMAQVVIRDEQYGDGYALETRASRAAAQRFAQDTGLPADSAYTAKALAALYADREAGDREPALFWYTWNGLLPAPETMPRGVPRALRHHFTDNRR